MTSMDDVKKSDEKSDEPFLGMTITDPEEVFLQAVPVVLQVPLVFL